MLGFELCQNIGGQHSVLFLNASSRFVLGDPEEIQYSISLSTLPKWTNKVCFGSMYLFLGLDATCGHSLLQLITHIFPIKSLSKSVKTKKNIDC